MHSKRILGLYANVADISDRMLAAARLQDWELLETLEAECSACIAIVKAQDRPQDKDENAHLSSEELKQKIRYIHKILATDKEIRQLIQPWMQKLSSMISNNGNQQKLHHAYGNQFGQ
jgi:flagellar protein FliT